MMSWRVPVNTQEPISVIGYDRGAPPNREYHQYFQETTANNLKVRVPRSKKWKILALEFTYTPDAVVGDRYPRLRINDETFQTGPTLWWWCQPVPASQQGYYMFLPSGPEAQYMVGALHVEYHPLPELILDGNYSIEVDVDIDAVPLSIANIIRLKLWTEEWFV